MSKLIKYWEPVKLQIREICLGCHPNFVWENSSKEIYEGIPVYIFHTIKPEEFEEKLIFLKRNNYITITAEDVFQILAERKKIRPKSVLLTFDDGRKSVWSTVFPLLKRYGFKATVFIIPGQMNDESNVSPNLDDIGKKGVDVSKIKDCDKSEQPLISWEEARIMHESGYIDIQCHMNNHLRIPIGPKIESFVNPDMVKRYFFKFEIPFMQGVEFNIDKYKSLLGAPIYQSCPGQLDRRMFIEDIDLRNLCVEYVRHNGGEKFFKNKHWQHGLKIVVNNYQKDHDFNNRYESKDNTRKRILNDLTSAKEKIEHLIPGKEVRHLSFPWGAGSNVTIGLLKRAGYVSAYWRTIPHRSINKPGDDPFKIVRLKHDYIWRLPGQGRKSLPEVFGFKIIRRITGKIDY